MFTVSLRFLLFCSAALKCNAKVIMHTKCRLFQILSSALCLYCKVNGITCCHMLNKQIDVVFELCLCIGINLLINSVVKWHTIACGRFDEQGKKTPFYFQPFLISSFTHAHHA